MTTEEDEAPPGRLVWPKVDPPDCPPCEPRGSVAMLFPASIPDTPAWREYVQQRHRGDTTLDGDALSGPESDQAAK